MTVPAGRPSRRRTAGTGDRQRAADRRVVRRAVAAGATVTVLSAIAAVAGVLAVGGSGALGLAGVLGAVTIGSLVTSAWLLLSVLFDLLAGDAPGGLRVRWTIGAVVFAFMAPILVLGALSAAART